MSTWVGIKIRKNKRIGEVIEDYNGMDRVLTVLFKDGKKEVIRLNNIGEDPPEVKEYEWYYSKYGYKEWFRF